MIEKAAKENIVDKERGKIEMRGIYIYIYSYSVNELATATVRGKSGSERDTSVLYADTATIEAAVVATASSARTLSKAAGRSNPALIKNWRLWLTA